MRVLNFESRQDKERQAADEETQQWRDAMLSTIDEFRKLVEAGAMRGIVFGGIGMDGGSFVGGLGAMTEIETRGLCDALKDEMVNGYDA